MAQSEMFGGLGGNLMFVERVLPAARKRLVTIAEDSPLLDAARLLGDFHTDLVVVCTSTAMLAGVITKTDVVRQISHCQGSGCTRAASAVMTRTVVLCHPSDLMHDVWSIMKERGLKNIPVVDQDSRPIGVLNARDALEVLLEEVEYEEVLLREYVMSVGYN
jgi:CBS domain-containing protein